MLRIYGTAPPLARKSISVGRMRKKPDRPTKISAVGNENARMGR